MDTTINISSARKNLYGIADDVLDDSKVYNVTTKKGDIVIMSGDNYRALQETLYLLGIPGLRESILEGMKEPGIEVDWEELLT